MTLWQRVAIAAAVVLVDLIAFAIPLTAIGIAYIVLARPTRFLDWVLALYEHPKT
jgi:hypothetical protein